MNAQPAARFDRTQEDLGNIVELGHVNITTPDQRLATLFYISGLGLTRDPYMMTGIDNMWVNVGRSQFHLPTGAPQVVRGVIGLVLPNLESLRRRLAAVQSHLQGTEFAFHDQGEYVEATCPWGNRIHCHTPDSRFGQATLGMPYVAFGVPTGSLPGVARFYREVLGAQVQEDAAAVRVAAGIGQVLLFREDDAALPPFDGHHVQITLVDFSGPHRRMRERGLVTREDDQHQWRFQNIIDPQDGRVLFAVEHEVRSMRHPMYARPMVNRNPAQTARTYTPGQDAWVVGMPG